MKKEEDIPEHGGKREGDEERRRERNRYWCFLHIVKKKKNKWVYLLWNKRI